MDENRVAGTARNVGGKAQEGLGRVVGDAKTQVEGIANQVKGTAQDLYGQARDGASQIADDTVAAARRTASSFESTLRDTIETQPTRRFLLRSALAGSWVECTVLCDVRTRNCIRRRR